MKAWITPVIGLLISLPVGAVTTQSFQVNATVAAGCSVTSGAGGAFGTLDFGRHNGVSAARVATGFVPNTSLNLACTPGVAISMAIDGGQHYGTVRNLQRANGAERVPYRLYTSASLAANSEIGVNQTLPVSYTNSNNITLPIFAAAQLTGLSPAGTYTDQLTVTLSW